MSKGNGTDRPDGDSDAADESRSLGGGVGVEIVTLADEQGRGVYLTCSADLTPQELVEGLCDLLTQVTRAALSRSHAERAGDLRLGEDVF